jgi:protein kinase C substrate 80K-H
LNNAARERKTLAEDAARLKKEIGDKIEVHKVLLAADEQRIEQAEAELAEEEKKERLRAVKAPKAGGKLGTLVSEGKRRTEELRNNLQQAKEQRDDAKNRVTELEEMLAKFKEEYNPNFNDEGVKRAVRAWEEYEARGRYIHPDPVIDRDLEQILLPDSSNGLAWEDYENIETDTDSCEWARFT